MAIKDNVQGLVLALFGASAGGHLTGLTASANANGLSALAGDLAASAGFILGKDLSSAAAFRDNMLSGLGISSTNSAYTDAAAWANGELAKPNANRGDIVAAAVNYLAGLTDTASPFYAAAAAYKTKVAAAVAWSEGSGASVLAVSTLQAQQANGGALSFTTAATDFIIGTASADIYTGKVAATGSTYQTGDQLVDGTVGDADTLTVSIVDDLSAIPTITNIETVTFNMNSITNTLNATKLPLAVDNISKSTVINVNNVAPVTAVNEVNITGDKGGVRNIDSKFVLASSDTTDSITVNMAAAGTLGTPAKVTLGAAAKNPTVTGTGFLTVKADTATGLLTATSAKALNLDATVVAAVNATAGGNITVVDVDSAKSLVLKATGNISVPTTKAAAALSADLTATGTVTADFTAATDVTVKAKTTATISETATALVTLTAAGNGGALKVGATGIGAGVLQTVVATGDQDVTFTFDASDLAALTSVVKSNTGKLNLVLGTARGDVDLSSTSVDAVELAVSNNAKTLTVASGQTVTLSADQAGTAIFAAPSASKTTNVMNLVLNDATADGNAVDLTDVKIKNVKTLNIDASVDKTAGGAASPSALTKLVLDTGNSTNVTVTTGSNGLTLGTVTLTDANTLTITGSGAIAGGSQAVTAATVDASAVTGVVTYTGFDGSATSTLLTGSGKDVVTVANDTAATTTINLDGGDDKLTLPASTKTNNLVLEGGDGTGDELVLTKAIELNAASGKTQTITGFEKLTYDSTTGTVAIKSIDAALISGKTYELKDGAGTETANTMTIKVGTSTAAIDLSGLTVATANKAAVNNDAFVIDSAATTSLLNIIGSNVTLNTITTSSAVAQAVVGGALVDTITVKAGFATITTGAGNDSVDVTAATGASATKFTTITDFTPTAATGTVTAVKDALVIAAGVNTVLTTAIAAGWTVLLDPAANTSNIQFKSGATLAQFVTAASAATNAGGANNVTAWSDGADLWIYSAGASNATTDDIMVKLVGQGAAGGLLDDATVLAAGLNNYIYIG